MRCEKQQFGFVPSVRRLRAAEAEILRKSTLCRTGSDPLGFLMN